MVLDGRTVHGIQDNLVIISPSTEADAICTNRRFDHQNKQKGALATLTPGLSCLVAEEHVVLMLHEGDARQAVEVHVQAPVAHLAEDN